METVVAFVVVHINVENLPEAIVPGEAVSVAVGVADPTVTVAVAVTVLLPIAVNVYCVVAVGLTFMDPDAATVPMP
jgi:hypothetical protein